ncbi:Thiamine repressible genes regulatory protein thi1 like [Verticillium longisporum]|nr:Thiamine repressible genes regulatory protein thi1 like [Verticillium longisporum]
MEREESAPAEPQPGKVGRSAAACHTCRSKKVKCSGSYPCRYCSKRNLECQFPGHGKRKLFSVSDIQNLEDRLHLYEQQSGQPSAKVARVARSESEGHVVLSSTASMEREESASAEPQPGKVARSAAACHTCRSKKVKFSRTRQTKVVFRLGYPKPRRSPAIVRTTERPAVSQGSTSRKI